ncbi:hypothetical protein HYPSUDRAFT_66247 [Hypholoma sublateritium FD-334 SS-4]|uniref:F-box domain-containing protein n=1 Tax=Hypholoma sublateritium (strain FD-334 SS-4) TaxID=945553 RepID=A0A0D2PVJ1_HYPSF|nr:hypothetical protein HYPSUDRAFT_66247 [Hypholoma sublateritium FD-334 SS-4]
MLQSNSILRLSENDTHSNILALYLSLSDQTSSHNPLDCHISTQFEATNDKIRVELTTLPAELLTEVLKLLTWKDILYLRMTCKYLSEVTRTRAIWAHLIDEYITSKPYPPLLERPIDMYTSGELEHQLLVWTSADLGWVTDDGHAARERSILAETPEFVHLIKGGRWLLVTTDIGAVTYYDLDADNITGVLLIPAQVHKPHPSYKIKMIVEIDTKSPVLSFKIGFFIIGVPIPQDSNPHPTGSKAMFQVWDVTLVLDDSRNGIGLSATELAVFDRPSAIRGILEFSFLGPAIAFIALIPRHGLYTFVLEWTQVVEDASKYYWRILNHASSSSLIQLLPEKRILVASSDYVKLFDYSLVKETLCTAQQSPHSPTLDPIWKPYIGHLFSGYMSMCFSTSDATRINFVSNRHIHSMVIRNASLPDEVPSLFHLVNAPGNGFFISESFLGFARSVAVDFDQDVWLVRYNFPDDESPGLLKYVRKHLKHTFLAMCRCPAVDEDSGRVVVSDYSESRELVIADFALIFTP